MHQGLILAAVSIFVEITAQPAELTKTVVHFCDLAVSDSCGPEGKCIKHRTGNRCQCPLGKMGVRCRRPCQDVYQSCKRWKDEDRCNWATPILPFFEDNCALSCGRCQSNGRRLDIPLPPILEPISWIIGSWETETIVGDRFPVSFQHPYTEVLDISISEVPMFDRPPVNVSVRAYTREGSEYNELGFMTGKPFHEVTGFAEYNKSSHGTDQVAIEMVSNTGITTIEEGELRDGEIVLNLKYKQAIPSSLYFLPRKSRRTFRLQDWNVLIEKTYVEESTGAIRKWIKRYRRTKDYLAQY